MIFENRKACVSWSGGKDSCLALTRAISADLNLTHLLTIFDENGARSRSHAVPLKVMRAQTDSLNLKLIAPSASWQTYEQVFVEQLNQLRAEENVETIVFGDIDLEAHREWEERVCAQTSTKAVLPLWGENRLQLVDEFLAAGFRAVVVCVAEKFLPKEFCGREFNRQFIADLPEGVDACGENGEFHTFVFDGPLFKNPVAYKITEIYRHAPVFPGAEAASFYHANLEI